MKKLTSRRHEIATTGGGLDPWKIAAYRELWISQGFLVPEWQGEPGFFTKSVNFAKAVVVDVQDGRPRVSEEVFQSRLATCRGCGLFNRRKVICGHPQCGCQLKVKARWASMECPIGRWGKQLTEERT